MKIKIGDTFTAGGHDYNVLSPDEAMTLERYKAFEWLKMENQFQASAMSISDKIAEANAILNGIALGREKERNILHVATIQQGIIDALKEKRYTGEYLLLICTLFVVRKSEPLQKWDVETARAKIANWSTSTDITVMDFFGLAAEWLPLLNLALKSAMKGEEQENQP